MLVFDICNRRSFEAIPRWLTYVRQVRLKNPLFCVRVMGYKKSVPPDHHLSSLNKPSEAKR